MWVIREQTTGKYFQALENGDAPIYVSEIEDAMQFETLDAEEDYRAMNIAYTNTQPFEVPES